MSCSSVEENEQEKIAKKNAVEELITRHRDDHYLPRLLLQAQKRESYPWEERMVGEFPKITKEYFRCRGSRFHPERKQANRKGEVESLWDCGGADKHSLPIQDQEEFVYPILLDILNELQRRLERRVVITCGHRCPEHNRYADLDQKEASSMHQIGAEVDFYVEGMEEQPYEVARCVMEFYEQSGQSAKDARFHVCTANPRSLQHPGWYNQEVILRVFQQDEGRDFDNRHPYPYLSLQVRRDRSQGKRVEYTWARAQNGVRRY